MIPRCGICDGTDSWADYDREEAEQDREADVKSWIDLRSIAMAFRMGLSDEMRYLVLIQHGASPV